MKRIRKYQMLLFITIAGIIISCNGNETPVDNYNRQAMNQYTAEEIIVPSYENFVSSIQSAEQLVDIFIQNPNLDNLSSLRANIKSARLSWQWCAMYSFGPALTSGLNAVANVYTIYESDIENFITNENYNVESIAHSNARGFKAIGYLLYGNNKTDEEIVNTFINSPARAQYLKTLVSVISTNADKALTAWKTGFIDSYSSAATAGTDAGSSVSILINEMNKYWESTTRDKKLGIPLGKRSLGTLLPDRTESYYAGYSTELLKENITAFKYLFEGRNSNGIAGEYSLSNYLKELKALDVLENNDLADVMSVVFDDALNQCDVVSDPLSTKVETNFNDCDSLYLLLQKQIIFMKSDMPSAMGISISYADNDGD
ncbi:imelysin family protein [Marinigracilibium pacificum]|uniref:Imelysin family protein n=1 Tax=Marinigracilibium pacificum TaxID=2729599 RepID=A0A848IYB6_9BACT|nr:imelysin family protein [Marinigracilibium pacificum]NMM46979.1 imelysin family protein [Marinigracilibium pacificum]